MIDQIRAPVDQELGANGFRPATGNAADMLLNHRLTTRAGEEINADLARFGWAWWGGSDVSSFDKGALYIGVIDSQAKHMIWVGAAEARLRPQMQISYEDRKKRIYDAVHGILLDRGVSEHPAHVVHIHSGHEEQARVGVPEAVGGKCGNPAVLITLANRARCEGRGRSQPSNRRRP